MKSDVIAAVIVGFVIGVGSAILAINLPSIIKKSSPLPKQTVTNTTPVIPSSSQIVNSSIPFDITEPPDDSIVETKSLKIKGKTQSGNNIILVTDSDSSVTEALADGTFSLSTNLSEGGNTIYITSQNSNSGEEETKTLNIFYTPEKL